MINRSSSIDRRSDLVDTLFLIFLEKCIWVKAKVVSCYLFVIVQEKLILKITRFSRREEKGFFRHLVFFSLQCL